MADSQLSKIRDGKGGGKKRAAPRSTLEAIRDGFQSYWDRQGRHANEGLQMAEQGAQSVRGGDLSGLPGMALGPMAYLGSPISALFPERSEVNAATDIPDWSKPFIAGGLETAAIMAPGPKGKGLGRGLASLADDATDAERAALKARLQADASDQAALDALDAANPGRDVSPETVRGWVKPKVTMESVMRDELAQAVAAGDTATAEKLRRELRGMGYSVEAEAANANRPTLGQAFARQTEDADATRGPRAPYTGPSAPAGSLPGALEEARQALRTMASQPGGQSSPEFQAMLQRIRALEAQIGQPGPR